MSTSPPAGALKAASPRSGWTPGPTKVQLVDGAVDVWCADLTTVGDESVGALSGEEHERAARIVDEQDRLLWTRSRGVLRRLLGRYLQEPPGAVQFAAGRHGKPELARERVQRPAPSFNLSHSRHLALYAFTALGPVGVDIQLARDEAGRSRTDHVALARRTFGDAEARRLALLDDAPREDEFLRLWTRYEAELKLRGTGIGGGERPPGGYASKAWLCQLDVGTRAAATVALERRASELRLWRLA
jgi:4'-phosphopantetheinyl transferase